MTVVHYLVFVFFGLEYLVVLGLVLHFEVQAAMAGVQMVAMADVQMPFAEALLDSQQLT